MVEAIQRGRRDRQASAKRVRDPAFGGSIQRSYAASGYKMVLGTEHPDTLQCMSSLALVLRVNQSPGGGEVKREEVKVLAREVLRVGVLREV